MQPVADAVTAVMTAERTAEGATGTACFSADLPVLAGHFPGSPLIPGVHVLALIAEVARRSGAVQGEVTGIARAKWSAMVLPGDNLTVAVTIKTGANSTVLDGTVTKADGVVAATARLRLS